MDLTYTPAQAEFRASLRAWLASNVPHDLATPGAREGFEQHRAWERRLFDAEYAGLSWASSYGGRGLDVVHQAIFEEEYLLADGPERVNIVGEKLMGRTLMKHGTDEQRARRLPRILSAEDVWSQGFSEPDAGSDRSEERRVGKECRCWWSSYHEKKKKRSGLVSSATKR